MSLIKVQLFGALSYVASYQPWAIMMSEMITSQHNLHYDGYCGKREKGEDRYTCTCILRMLLYHNVRVLVNSNTTESSAYTHQCKILCKNFAPVIFHVVVCNSFSSTAKHYSTGGGSSSSN